MRSLKSMRPRDNIIGIDSNLVYNDPFPLDKLTIEQSACPLCVKFLSSKPSALFYSAKLSTQDAALLASSKVHEVSARWDNSTIQARRLISSPIRHCRTQLGKSPTAATGGDRWVTGGRHEEPISGESGTVTA
jgi:hypothetical protein